MSEIQNGLRMGSEIKKVRLRGKGQFTIPSEIRDNLGIDEDTILEVFPVGNGFIATPEKLTVKELASAVRKDMKFSHIDLKELLAELREGGHEYEED
ncbi:MAG: AbrB/MazE/SpoVT family DNA-binding domain-containing protein [Thermacetogeniaceae bacterium]|jgi:AbrB family looped-hinge helix DNA binding protein